MSEDPSASPKPTDELSAQVAELSRRLALLERRLDPNEEAPPEQPGGELPDGYWALKRLRAELAELGAAQGGVLYVGSVTRNGGELTEWQGFAPVDSLLGTDWAELAEVFAALGQPVRLLVIHALLEGRTTVAELTGLDGLGTTGQIYHHLRQLVSAGWLQPAGRGHYRVPPHRLVPLMVLLAAGRR
ncbi:ArsR family transcriptional regulator [Streptomyces sp. NPDC000594]|uniref:ArsR/SmtB family transcription factor n=1 Tax=Streptomyces sp. NPDC000594 TaxID=3154261 RepID=UPI003329837F